MTSALIDPFPEPTTTPALTSRPLWRRLLSLPNVLTVIYTAAIGILIAHHAMWRDEAQAFLIARDSHSPGELLWNLRYEGHPPLWHLLLWVLTRFTQRPEAMQVLHLLMSSATVYLVTRFAPFPWPAKLLFPFGYFTLFEYSVIARNYQLLLLLAAALCILWQHRWNPGKRYFIWLGVVLALLSLTHVLGIILGAGFGLMLLAETLATPAGWSTLRRDWWRFLLGIAIAGAATAWAVKLLIPPPDYSFAVGWAKDFNHEHVQVTLYTLWNGLVPVPHWTPDFWGDSNILLPEHFAEGPGKSPLDAAAFWAPYAGIACVLLVILSWRAMIVVVVAGGGALAFAHLKMVNLYGVAGGTRHHGIYFLIVLVACWIAFAGKAWPAKWWRRMLWLGPRLGLTALLAVHAYAALVPVDYTLHMPFSNSRQAADVLRPKLGPNDVLVAPIDYIATPVFAYLPGHEVFLADEGQWRSFAYWRRIVGPRKSVTAWCQQIARERNVPVILAMYGRGSFPGAELIGQAGETCIQNDEHYFLYRFMPPEAGAATRAGAAATR